MVKGSESRPDKHPSHDNGGLTMYRAREPTAKAAATTISQWKEYIHGKH